MSLSCKLHMYYVTPMQLVSTGMRTVETDAIQTATRAKHGQAKNDVRIEMCTHREHTRITTNGPPHATTERTTKYIKLNKCISRKII